MSNTLKILNEKEVKKIVSNLKEQFEVKTLPGVLVMRGADRIFLFTGEINEKNIAELDKKVPIERAGVYFAKWENDQIRLSIEGTQILGKQIKKNIVELETYEQVETWMSGQELLIQTGMKGIVAINYKGDFLGCGKASENKITNFIPKNRRLKLKTTIK